MNEADGELSVLLESEEGRESMVLKDDLLILFMLVEP